VVNLNVDPIGTGCYTSNQYDNQRRKEAFERYGFARGLEPTRKEQLMNA